MIAPHQIARMMRTIILLIVLIIISACGQGSYVPAGTALSPEYSPEPVLRSGEFSSTATPTVAEAEAVVPVTNIPEQVTLSTQDGLTLVFDHRNGRFMSMAIQSRSFQLPADTDLAVYLLDESRASLLNPRHTPIIQTERIADGLIISRETTATNLQTIERWTVQTNRVDLETTIVNTDTTLPFRAIEACLQIPLDLVNAYWYHHFEDREPIIKRSEPYKTVLQPLVDIGSFDDGSFHLKTDLDINLHGLNLIGNDEFGLAISINPERPAAYYVRYDPQRLSYEACFHLGIYNKHIRFGNQASFALSLFVPDEPQWGLRSAYGKYIAIYPQSHQGKLARKTTMVVLEEYLYDVFPDPREYHIGAVWGRYKAQNRRFGVDDLVYIWPHGYYDRGMRLKIQPSLTGSIQTWEADIAACFALYEDIEQGRSPFIEVCRGSYPFATCTRQKEHGRIYGPVFDHGRANGWWQAEAYQMTISNGPNFLIGKFQLPQPIAASLLQDSEGRWLNAMSYASLISEVPWEPGFGRCIFDGINPDPGIEVEISYEPGSSIAPRDLPNFGLLNLEVVKRAHGLYGSGYLDEHPDEGITLYHGAAVDTVGIYLRPDFNPRALRTASLPLSYDRTTGQVVVLEHLSTLASLHALRASLPPDAPIAVSEVPISGLLYQEADYILDELLPIEREGQLRDEFYDESLPYKLRLLNRIRMGANQRPITLSVRFDRATDEQSFLEQIQRYLPLYTAKGIYVNIDRWGNNPERYSWSEPPLSQDVLRAYREHLHTVHLLNAAGWQAVPYVTAEESILTERFGQEFLTFYNSNEKPLVVTVMVNWRAMGLDVPPSHLTDLNTGAELTFRVTGDNLVIDRFALDGFAARILQIRK